jgi:hypothetical protein
MFWKRAELPPAHAGVSLFPFPTHGREGPQAITTRLSKDTAQQDNFSQEGPGGKPFLTQGRPRSPFDDPFLKPRFSRRDRTDRQHKRGLGHFDNNNNNNNNTKTSPRPPRGPPARVVATPPLLVDDAPRDAPRPFPGTRHSTINLSRSFLLFVLLPRQRDTEDR